MEFGLNIWFPFLQKKMEPNVNPHEYENIFRELDMN